MEMLEDKEYVLNTYLDERDTEGMDLGLSDSNMVFEEEVELTNRRIMTGKQRTVWR
jgi:hypothetical protein